MKISLITTVKELSQIQSTYLSMHALNDYYLQIYYLNFL